MLFLPSNASKASAWMLLSLALLAQREAAAAPEAGKRLSWHTVQIWAQPQGLPQNSVMTLLQTKDGYLWIGTHGGLSRFDGVRFTTFDDQNTDLTENEIWGLAEADDGGVWVGTYGGGLSRMKDDKFIATYTVADGLANDFINTLHNSP